MAKRISIINFKGGVGKTTLAFHIGTGLAWQHDARVLLVDMDHQSSLSLLCLQANGWQAASQAQRTIDEVFRHFVEDGKGLPGNEIVIQSPMSDRDSDYDSMDIVPATLTLDDIEVDLTATHKGNPIHSEWNKRTLICRWIEANAIDDQYDYIIFDCPPATKIVSQNAIAASHGYLIPVVPEAVMERGVPHLYEMMRSGIDARLNALAPMAEDRPTHVPDTKLVGLVITRIQTARAGYTIDHTQHLMSLRMRWEDLLLEPYISQGTGVSEALPSNKPVYNYPHTQNIGKREIDKQYIDLIERIKQRVDAL